MKRLLYWLTTPRLLTAILFMAIFTMAVRVPADTDTWWHLRSGQYIVENQTIYTTDPFSHTQTGREWMYPKLAQVLGYGLFAGTGWMGVSLGLAALVTVAFALVWRVTPGNLYLRVFATILGVLTSALTWVARPQMISFALAGLVLLLLERYKRAGSRWIYSLPIIVILWVNMHGGYAIAFMLVGAYLVGETLNRLTRPRADTVDRPDPALSWRQLGLLVGIAAVSFIAVAINPHGWQMWLYPFQTVGIGALRDFIQEWRSPDFHASMTWPFVIMLLLMVVAMGSASRYVDWTDLALVSLWTVWSLFAVRNVGLFGLLTVPVLARYADAAAGAYLPVPGKSLTRRQPALIYLNWLLLAAVMLAATLQIGSALWPLATTEPGQENLPVAAVQFIRENRPPGPMFNSYNWGGYLIYKLWPDYPVYIDGRTDLYDNAFIRRYLNVMLAGEGWEQTLAEDGVNLVIIEKGSVLAKFLKRQPGWQEIYGDEIAVIYVRKSI
ncbi:MAG: hypothetical protein JXM69_21210 [Anaerolineae bacterium]|nr:hypothetical protein [Anaerolineae bacterium]